MSSDSDLKDDDKEDEEEYYDEYPPIVIDNGSGTMKCGFASLTNEQPTSIFDTVVGHNKTNDVCGTYVGTEAFTRHKKLSIIRPIKNGLITNWDNMELIWKHIFENELKVIDDIEECTIMMSEVPLNTRYNREKQIQIMFESYQCNAYYTQNCAVLDLYAHGKTTGLVVGSGYGVSYTVPIYQGYGLAHATHRMEIGGKAVSDYFLKLLARKDQNIEENDKNNRFEIIESIKQNECFVSYDFENELATRNSLLWKNASHLKYSLPDGHIIDLTTERLECTEILFRPHLIGKKHYSSIARCAHDSALRVNIDVRKDVLSNVVLSGGSTLLNGFTERFTKDFKQLVPSSMKMNMMIHSNKQRALSTYLGASIFASLSFFKDACITSEEYEENGPKIVNRKCF